LALWLYVARRLVVLVPTLFFVSVLIFSLQQLLPGDAAVALAGGRSPSSWRSARWPSRS
jgi:ABC-type dipeptide/oligopeptide/nickel transport system permease component